MNRQQLQPPSPPDRRAGYRPLSRRYAAWMCGLTLALLLSSAAIETWFGYRAAVERVEAVQEAQTEGAAREIEHAFAVIQTGLKDVAKMPWGAPGYGPQQRREEFYRLMQLVPAITELQAVDASGRERVAASRSAPDRFDALTEVPETELWRGVSAEGLREGRTFFREGYLPTMRLAVFDGEGVVIATVDLRLLGEAIARVKAGPGGTAYVVDAQGLLIAHPQPTVLLSRLDLSRSPAVAAAFGAPASAPLPVRGLATEGLQREPVIVSAARVPGTSWLVFTEQLRGEALRPVWATLWRSLVLTLVGGLLALGLGIVFARRMAAPIVALRQATARIAGGDLESRLNVQPLDEIGDLAHDFDQMLLRLRELYASLEAKVASRTAELAERKEEAERANAAKTRFLAAASHDLRQPMHSISLLVGLLHQALREASQRQLAEKIQSSVATMESLFGNLLDISKLDAGTVRPHIEDVDLGWLLQRLEHTWAPQAEEKGLRLRVRPSAWTVRGDSALLERIVGNLVANAVRYTARGGVLVACRRRQGRCELQVWDTGPGIAPEHRQAIFEEFFRIDAPGTAQEKGLGLGLAIVQRCAGILGYDLAVDSRVGRGSVFRLSMPFVDGLGLLAMPAPPGLEPQGLAGQFIVVVDDDETNRSVLAQVLTAWHCHVVAAASADELLEQLQGHLRTPDLIVTDFQLGPGADGVALIERMRLQYDEAIPALVVTANTDALVTERCQACEARLLHKPIGLQRLLEAIREVLSS